MKDGLPIAGWSILLGNGGWQNKTGNKIKRQCLVGEPIHAHRAEKFCSSIPYNLRTNLRIVGTAIRTTAGEVLTVAC